MRISVVTVCRNAAATIGQTVSSFLAQTHADKEMLIIDGASSDGTVDIARAAGGDSVTVVSAPDRGLYDAMNKGLAAFQGDAVGFLNADDRFHDENALEAVAASLEQADICYGDLDFIDAAQGGQVVRRWRATPWRKGGFRRGWMPAHPTFYCRRRVVEQVGAFDLRYRVAADYDFMLRALELRDFTAARIEQVLVDMGAGGVSTSGFGAQVRHNLEALDARRRWLGAGFVDYALFAKPLSKASQLVFAGERPVA
jgi:glycosyltransferase involved in cell wall biosynthesis